MCIGTYSDTYVPETFNSKWSSNCVIESSYYKTCSSCSTSGYIITDSKGCEKCLNISNN